MPHGSAAGGRGPAVQPGSSEAPHQAASPFSGQKPQLALPSPVLLAKGAYPVEPVSPAAFLPTSLRRHSTLHDLCSQKSSAQFLVADAHRADSITAMLQCIPPRFSHQKSLGRGGVPGQDAARSAVSEPVTPSRQAPGGGGGSRLRSATQAGAEPLQEQGPRSDVLVMHGKNPTAAPEDAASPAAQRGLQVAVSADGAVSAPVGQGPGPRHRRGPRLTGTLDRKMNSLEGHLRQLPAAGQRRRPTHDSAVAASAPELGAAALKADKSADWKAGLDSFRFAAAPAGGNATAHLGPGLRAADPAGGPGMLPEGPAQSSGSQRGSGRLPALQPSREPQFSPRGAGGKRTARRAQHPRVSGEQLEGLAQNLQSLEQQLDSLPQPVPRSRPSTAGSDRQQQPAVLRPAAPAAYGADASAASCPFQQAPGQQQQQMLGPFPVRALGRHPVRNSAPAGPLTAAMQEGLAHGAGASLRHSAGSASQSHPVAGAAGLSPEFTLRSAASWGAQQAVQALQQQGQQVQGQQPAAEIKHGAEAARPAFAAGRPARPPSALTGKPQFAALKARLNLRRPVVSPPPDAGDRPSAEEAGHVGSDGEQPPLAAGLGHDSKLHALKQRRSSAGRVRPTPVSD